MPSERIPEEIIMPTHSSPLVSVMIPYHNCKEYIAETIASVEAQTYPNLEIIIIDDGSSPEHADYLQALLSEKQQIRFEIQANMGAAAARNHAALLATGKYFLFLDADDVILPEYIEQSVEKLENDANCKLVYPKAEFFDAQSGYWDLAEYQGMAQLLEGNHIPIIAIHHAEDFRRIGGFDDHLPTHEDWDLWIRLLENGGTAYTLPQILFRYRKRQDQSSLIDNLQKNEQIIPENWQKVYLKNNLIFMKHHLSYYHLISKKRQLDDLQLASEQNGEHCISAPETSDNALNADVENQTSDL